MKYTFHLPWFPEFYESALDDKLDLSFERYAEDMDLDAAQLNLLRDKADWQRGMLSISRAWLKCFNDVTELSLDFVRLWSPREYNFHTDKVVCSLRASEVYCKMGYILKGGASSFGTLVKERCTSRSGFIPFHSNDVRHRDWRKPLSLWSDAQRELLLEAFLLDEGFQQEELEHRLSAHTSISEAADDIFMGLI